MKICLLTTQMGVGGAERQVATLADGFASKGYRVKIISLLGSQKIFPSDKSIEYVSLMIDKRDPLSLIRGALTYIQIIHSFKPDIIHSHAVHANLFARALRPLSGRIKLVNTAHSQNEGGKSLMFAYRLTNWLGDIFTIVSKEAAEIYYKKGVAKRGELVVIHNAINTDVFSFKSGNVQAIRGELGLSDEDRLILSVGRLSLAKDYKNLIDAAKIVKSRYGERSHFFIVGEGELDKTLKEYVNHNSLQETITFLGLRNDIAELISAADLFVLSSQWEGLPLVVGEAMACEQVIVATDCGGTREFLGDDTWLVPVGDPEALAEKIMLALNNSSGSRRRIGSNNRRIIQEGFSLDVIIDRWISIFKALS